MNNEPHSLSIIKEKVYKQELRFLTFISTQYNPFAYQLFKILFKQKKLLKFGK